MDPNFATINNNNNNMPEFDCKTKMKEIWESIPFFTKFVIVFTTLLYFLNLFFPIVSFYFSNLPYYTIQNFQFWRLFSAVYLTTSILNILFALLAWVKEASSLEKTMGTLKYLGVFSVNSVIIQIIYTGIMYLVSFIFNNKQVLVYGISMLGGVEANGLWPIIMAEITMLCMANPNENMKIFIFPCLVKAKYYPFLLFGFFTLLSGFQVQFDVLSGILYGVLHHFVLKDKLTLTDRMAKRLEDCIPFRFIKKIRGYVPMSSSGLPFSTVRVAENSSSIDDNDDTVDNSNSRTDRNKYFKAFKSKGVTVGGSLDTSTSEYENVSQNSQTTNITNSSS